MSEIAKQEQFKTLQVNGHVRWSRSLVSWAGELYLGLACGLLRRKLGSCFVDRFIFGTGLFPHTVIREAERFGYRMRLDLHDQISRMVYFLGSHEPTETAMMQALIQPDWIVVNVGAQIGFHTLMAARRVNPNLGHVYAIEPNPTSFEQLRHHIWVNDVPHVTILRQAIGDTNGAVMLYPGPDHNTGLASTFDRGYDVPPICVEQTTLDAFVLKYGLSRLDLIKVDVEGCEAAVFRGATETMRRFKPAVLLELNERMLLRAGSSSIDIAATLRDLGYRLYMLSPDRRELSDGDIRAFEFLNVLATCAA